MNADTLRAAARLMREQHGPEHKRHKMWSAMADWLADEAGEHDRYEAIWVVSSQDPRNSWQERGLTVEANLAHHFGHPLTVARAYLEAS